jgi:hypothetical protein
MCDFDQIDRSDAILATGYDKEVKNNSYVMGPHLNKCERCDQGNMLQRSVREFAFLNM